MLLHQWLTKCLQMQMGMESCPIKAGMSGVMGGVLGGAFGLFMASVSRFLSLFYLRFIHVYKRESTYLPAYHTQRTSDFTNTESFSLDAI